MFYLLFVCVFREVRPSHQPAVPQTSSHHSSAHTGESTPGHHNINISVGLNVFEYYFLQSDLFPFTLQSAMLGNGLVLQNLLHMQLAQQQLLHIKDKRISSVRHLFVCMCVCGSV